MSKEVLEELTKIFPTLQTSINQYIKHLENERQLTIANQLRILLQVSEEYIKCQSSK